MKTLSTLIIALGLAAAMRPAFAAEVTLNFNDADLVSVIDSVSRITGRNFIVDPRVQGKVNVVSSKPLNEEQVYDLFLSILQVHGFAAIPGENAIKIVPDATARQIGMSAENGGEQTPDFEI